jgi:hypothetical protein
MVLACKPLQIKTLHSLSATSPTPETRLVRSRSREQLVGHLQATQRQIGVHGG